MSTNEEGIERHLAERLGLTILIEAANECGALRAENERLEQQHEYDMVTIERGSQANERLTKAFADSEAACLIQVQMVRAENERLRAAFRLVEPLLKQELYSDEWERIQALIAWPT